MYIKPLQIRIILINIRKAKWKIILSKLNKNKMFVSYFVLEKHWLVFKFYVILQQQSAVSFSTQMKHRLQKCVEYLILEMYLNIRYGNVKLIICEMGNEGFQRIFGKAFTFIAHTFNTNLTDFNFFVPNYIFSRLYIYIT